VSKNQLLIRHLSPHWQQEEKELARKKNELKVLETHNF
jgi:hypothetical protein